MCIVIDANTAHAVFSNSPHTEYRPVIDWLFRKPRNSPSCGWVVIGGKLRGELAVSGDNVRRALVALKRAGRLHEEDDGDVDAKAIEIESTGLCTSDDPHVISLVVVSGARTVCTEDLDLMVDVGNGGLVSRPRGKVYTRRRYSRSALSSLLFHTSSCPFNK